MKSEEYIKNHTFIANSTNRTSKLTLRNVKDVKCYVEDLLLTQFDTQTSKIIYNLLSIEKV